MTNRNDIERLFNAGYGSMYGLAVAILHDEDAARDVVHDLFVSLLENPPQEIPGRGYLLRAVRNRCLNHIRNSDIRERIRNLWLVENGQYETDDWPDEDSLARVRDILARDVTPQGRRVVELRFTTGLRFSEIAAEMGISETAVYRHLRHALIVIRQKLSENGQV